MAEETAPAPVKAEQRAGGMSLGKVFVIVFVAALVGSFSGVMLGGLPFQTTGNVVRDTNPTPTAPTAPQQPNPNPVAPTDGGTVSMSSILDDDPFFGSADAPVTIVEFSDYECPFCGRHATGTFPSIKTKYIDTGKVKYVVRDFPLSFHPQAQKGAEATDCANEQGKFQEMHDKIFANQASMSVASFKQWARDLGLNGANFDSCLDTGKYAAEVNSDFSAGAALGVSGTPTFFIGRSGGNGEKLVGALPTQTFEATIEKYLS